jgi:hypothetical protein
VSNNALTESLRDDKLQSKTHSYRIISDGKTSVEQFTNSFVKKMIETSEKGFL